MNIAINSREIDISLPSEEEIDQAVRVCCGRYCRACETPVEYAWRKRQTDLAYLVGLAVEKELTETEREYIKELFWNKKLPGRIAAEKGVSPSAVSMSVARAKRKLRKALEYVIIYQNELVNPDDSAPLFEHAFAVHFTAADGADLPSSLRRIRARRGIPLETEARALGIEQSRLSGIESGEITPLPAEVLGICEICNVIKDDDLMKG